MEFSLRQASRADSSAISALLRQLGYEVPPPTVAKRLADPRTGDRVLLAQSRGGTVLGVIAYSQPIARLAEGGSFIRITTLVVDESARKSGAGRALVSAVEQRAKAEGATLTEVSSGRREDRDAAHKFYPRLGYEDTGTKSVIYRKTL
jgi:ribosomal protein S18 acetylase RimI-like enzyme